MIVNLTPHPIHIHTSGGVVTYFPHVQIPLIRQSFGTVTDLPEPRPGVLLVVSGMVKAACPGRDDLVSPAKIVRDDEGRITGCEALSF